MLVILFNFLICLFFLSLLTGQEGERERGKRQEKREGEEGEGEGEGEGERT